MPPWASTDDAHALTTAVVWLMVDASGPVQLHRSPITNGLADDAAPACGPAAPVANAKPATRAPAASTRPPRIPPRLNPPRIAAIPIGTTPLDSSFPHARTGPLRGERYTRARSAPTVSHTSIPLRGSPA